MDWNDKEQVREYRREYQRQSRAKHKKKTGENSYQYEKSRIEQKTLESIERIILEHPTLSGRELIEKLREKKEN